MDLIRDKNYYLNIEDWDRFNNFIKMKNKRNKSLTEIAFNPKSVKNLDLKFNIDEPPEVKYCEYCGRKIEDKNDTGSLCYRCYMREYYGER